MNTGDENRRIVAGNHVFGSLRRFLSRNRCLFVLVLMMSCLIGAALPSPAWAFDRASFGRVLKTIPPNGSFWEYGNVTMRSQTRGTETPPVIFPHWVHRARYTCEVCHLELGFSMRAGGSGISRQQYLAGFACGTCHDGQTAFTARDESTNCERCHIKDTRGLQKRFYAFFDDMPKAKFGNGIDWALAQRKGTIKQASTLQSRDKAMTLPDKLKKPLKLGTTSARSDVLFSHEEHFAEMDCSNCHPDLFNIEMKGTQAFTMSKNIYGFYCGACHMKVAFPMNDCRRCHPKMKSLSRRSSAY